MTIEHETHIKHHEYLALLIEREKQRAAFRQAIIEKTLASLLWTAVVAICTFGWAYIKGHWV
jgi:hypothetical protein